MRIYVLAVLLLTFLLVSDSEAGWFRRSLRRVRARRLAKFIRRNEPWIRYTMRVSRKMGKRSAELPCPPDKDDDGMDKKKALDKLKELAFQCPNIGINGQKLPREMVVEAFDKVDTDNDQAFDDDELKEFENVLDAFQVCADTTAAQASDAQGGKVE